jgi:hypothetical protein
VRCGAVRFSARGVIVIVQATFGRVGLGRNSSRRARVCALAVAFLLMDKANKEEETMRERYGANRTR